MPQTIVTLISAGTAAGLTEAAVADVAGALGFSVRTDWLGAGEACDLIADSLHDRHGVLRKARAALGTDSVDVVVQEASGRRRKLLIADMDSTIIDQECIDELAAAFGVAEKVVSITERAMRGELDFSGALRDRVALLEGMPVTLMEEVFDSRVTIRPGARTLVQTMRGHGAYTALVSGGFRYFTGRVAAATGFDDNRANDLEHVDGKLTGRVIEPVLGREAKVEALNAYAKSLSIGPDDAIAVGDGANDLAMIDVAGMGVGFHAKPAVREAADADIWYSDLTALLYMQGFRRTEFRDDAD